MNGYIYTLWFHRVEITTVFIDSFQGSHGFIIAQCVFNCLLYAGIRELSAPSLSITFGNYY